MPHPAAPAPHAPAPCDLAPWAPAAHTPLPRAPVPHLMADGGNDPAPCPDGAADGPHLFTNTDDLATVGLACRVAPTPAMAVALKAVEAGWLWPELRVKGGAYGIRTAFCDGIAVMWSARDPAPRTAIATMRQSGAWLAGGADQAVLDRARTAVFADIMAPPTRAQSLARGIMRRIAPAPPWPRDSFAQLHAMTLADLAAAGADLAKALESAQTAVIASPATLARADFDPARATPLVARSTAQTIQTTAPATGPTTGAATGR